MKGDKSNAITKFALSLLVVFFSAHGFSQENDVSFLMKAIRQNYAGYHDKITDRAFDEYENGLIEKYKSDTFKILSMIADYFEDPHLKIYAYPDIKVDSVLFKARLNEINNYFKYINHSPDRYEGYWINDRNTCLIALKRVRRKSYQYESVVVQSKYLPLGMINGKFEKEKGNKFRTEYYTPSGGYHVYLTTEFRNDSVFTIGPYSKWRKLSNYCKPISLEDHFDERVRGKLLDKENYVIIIPDNSEENTHMLDSLVKAEYSLIGSTKNLIIDIRNNLGGTVRTYSPLFPFIYTGPIQKISGYKYYTKALAENYETEFNQYKEENPSDSSLIKKKEKYLENLKRNIGRVIMDTGSLIKFDSIKMYPLNVAIIANFACLSAAEMMILDFNQSKKVTLFGEHTYGGVDYLDDYDLDLPSKKYQLSIASFKRIIPKGFRKIDNVGIYPDVPILNQESDWIQFVKRYYSKMQKKK